ncbi:MAG: hypothetical protein U5N58_13185 [Actinomycetota bacterium]|nr:hypothetical protein [Actinomycetota bacterium]
MTLKKKGISIPLTDALIAAVIRNNASVLTLDKHFKDISLVTPLIIEL